LGWLRKAAAVLPCIRVCSRSEPCDCSSYLPTPYAAAVLLPLSPLLLLLLLLLLFFPAGIPPEQFQSSGAAAAALQAVANITGVPASSIKATYAAAPAVQAFGHRKLLQQQVGVS
jgi:hypothetical protein